VDGRIADRLLRQKVFTFDIQRRRALHDLVGEDFGQGLVGRISGNDLFVDDGPLRRADHGNARLQIKRGVQLAQMFAQQHGGHVAQVGADTQLGDQGFGGIGAGSRLPGGACGC